MWWNIQLHLFFIFPSIRMKLELDELVAKANMSFPFHKESFVRIQEMNGENNSSEAELKKQMASDRKEHSKPAVRKLSCVERAPLVIDPELTRCRRHSWTMGNPSPLSVHNSTFVQEMRDGSLSKCSSTSSVCEAIEECTSDEEVEEEVETSQSFDYMKCKACNKVKDSTKDKFSDNTDYCFACRQFYTMTELFRQQGLVQKQRRSSWTAGDRRDVYIPRKLSKHSRGSASGSMELPVISEPDTDDIEQQQ